MDAMKPTAQPHINAPAPTNRNPLVLDRRLYLIPSFSRESFRLKSQTDNLERKVARLKDENILLEEAMYQLANLDIEIKCLEERIAGMMDEEMEELRVRLVDREARMRVLEIEQVLTYSSTGVSLEP